MLFNTCLSQTQTLQEQELHDKIKTFDNYLNQATYGEEQFEKRIDIYKKILLLIEDGIGHQERELFVKTLHGLFETRTTHNQARLLLLRNLLHQTLRIAELKSWQQNITHWIKAINTNLEAFALRSGDIIALKDSRVGNYMSVIKPNKTKNVKLVLDTRLDKKLDGVLDGSHLFVIHTDKDKCVLYYGDSITLTPLYAHQKTHAHALKPTSKLAALTTVRRGRTFHELGITHIESNKTGFKLEGMCNSTKNTPVLPSDTIRITHTQTDQAITVKSYAQKKQLGLKKITRFKRGKRITLDEQENKSSCFCIEKISEQKRAELENQQFKQALACAQNTKNLTQKINFYTQLFDLLNKHINPQYSDIVFNKLQALFYERDTKNIVLLKKLRALYAKASLNQYFESRQLEMENFAGHINNDLMPLGLRYGDIISITSQYHTKRVLWAHNQSRFSHGNHLEILAGPNTKEYTQDGPQLFKIEPNKEIKTKKIVEYGDSIRLVALYAGSETINHSLGNGQRLWANPSSYAGKSFYEIVIGPNSCAQAQNGQEVFYFKRPNLGITTKHNPVLPSDIVEIWSREYNRKVWVNNSSLSFKNAHEIFVGPNDDNYLGINRTQNGQQLFKLNNVTRKSTIAIAHANFATHVKRINTHKDYAQKISHAHKLLSYMNKNKDLSETAKEVFLGAIRSLFEKRERKTANELRALIALFKATQNASFESSQKNLAKNCEITLHSEAIGKKLTDKLKLVPKQKTYRAKINVFRELVPLATHAYAKRHALLFVNALTMFTQEHNNMNAHELDMLKILLDKSLAHDYTFLTLPEEKKLLHNLRDTRNDLVFQTQFKKAEAEHGLKQIDAYKAIGKRMSLLSKQHKIKLIKSLKNILGEKVQEAQAAKMALQAIVGS